MTKLEIQEWWEKRGERGRRGEKGRGEENLREWDSQDGPRTEMRARKEIS